MLPDLLQQLDEKKLFFNDVLLFIESKYQHIPTAFKNGSQVNAKNQNQGSAKVLAFGKLENLSIEDTLKLFAEHYHAVLETPNGIDHQNIRQFIQNGWEGVVFNGIALTEK